MSVKARHSPYLAATTGGAVLWIGAALAGGRMEAWDSPLYWGVAYPLCILLAGALGYFFPERPWRWALAVMLVQPVLLVFSGSDFGLLPLGLVLFAFLSLPAIGLAQFAAWLARRRSNT